MRHANNEKWETTHDRRNRTTKSRKNQNVKKKWNLPTLGNKQMEMKEKNEKRATKENQKATRDKTISHEPCQRDKYLGCSPRKISCTRKDIKQMEQRTNELMTMYYVLNPRDDVDRIYVSRKEG